MQIELIGCTGAGKSTLAQGVLQASREQGIMASMGDDFVLEQFHLQRIKHRLARTLCVDIVALFACLTTWRKNLAFYRFVIRVITRLPTTVAWSERLNIARNILKKVGVYEIVHRCCSDQQIVLVDEGTLHSAHNLFVHVSVEPNIRDVCTLARLVPLPNMAIHVQQAEQVLVERTLERGHKRIPDSSPTQVERFVKHAVHTFDKLIQQLVLESRLSMPDGGRDLVVAPECQNDPLVAVALRIIRAGRDTGSTANPTALMPDSRLQDSHTAPPVSL
jgi:deoxyadenosine/deoxycytidine kinase